MNLLFLSLGPDAPLPGEASAWSLLDEVCREAHAEVVLCGPPRWHSEGVDPLNQYFQRSGRSHIRIRGTTTPLEHGHPGHEVMAFLDHFNAGVARYVVLSQDGPFFVWQPWIRHAPGQVTHEVAYEVLRHLQPDSPLLRRWEQEQGCGDLLTLVPPL